MMSEEKRLIDANALMSYMDECSKESRFRVYYGYAKSFIDDAPTIDAEVIVRCKDCKYRTEFGNCEHLRQHGILPVAYPYDFCSYGERKDPDNAT